MELMQRKRINNIPRFDNGADRQAMINQQNASTQNAMNSLDSKVSQPSQQSVFNSITKSMGGNAPKNMPASSPSFNLGLKGWKSNGSGSGSGIDTGDEGGGVSAGTVSSAVSGTIGMINSYTSMQDAVKNNDQLMAQSGQRTDQAFGVNYQAQNDINEQKAMDDISASNRNLTLGAVGSGAAAGAAVGSCFPGLGTVIGGAAGAITGLFVGLFGSRKAKERQRRNIFNAQQKVNLVNQINRSTAATEGLTQQYYLDNGNTKDDILYANRGKDLRKPRYVKRK